jgi:hypothetical protein
MYIAIALIECACSHLKLAFYHCRRLNPLFSTTRTIAYLPYFRRLHQVARLQCPIVVKWLCTRLEPILGEAHIHNTGRDGVLNPLKRY